MNPREKTCTLIESKTKLDNLNAKDLEIGIYNWAIEYANSKKIFKSWKNNRFTMLYFEKVRSILSNINPDSYLNNQGLIARIQDKECLPHEVAYMKPDILFPERWKDTTEAYFKKYEHAYENKVEAMSSDYKCGKCRKRKVVYHEIFSRSADEAAVIHICCLECGNRWKIG